MPDEGEIEKVGISIDGLDMDYDVYEQILKGESRYETDEQLETYLFGREGKDAAVKWLGSLVERNREKVMEAGSGSGYTHAVVCYHLKSGKEVYRIYPVSEERLQAYASVYETEEYKQAAYQVPDSRYVMDARFLWSDGVTDTTVLKLEDDEKEALLDAWKSDVESMKMENLREALPLGFIDVDSEVRLVSANMVVYPNFSRTCDFWKNTGFRYIRRCQTIPLLR